MSAPKWTFDRVEGRMYGYRARFFRTMADWFWCVEPDMAPSENGSASTRAEAWRQALAAAKRLKKQRVKP